MCQAVRKRGSRWTSLGDVTDDVTEWHVHGRGLLSHDKPGSADELANNEHRRNFCSTTCTPLSNKTNTVIAYTTTTMAFHRWKAYNNRKLSDVTLKFRSSSVFYFILFAYSGDTSSKLSTDCTYAAFYEKLRNKSQQTCCHTIGPGRINSWQILNIEGKHSYVFNYLLGLLLRKQTSLYLIIYTTPVTWNTVYAF